jgi:histidinol-phosphate aminotransferase
MRAEVGDDHTATRVHGGILPEELAALGIDPDEIVDFSSSTNPYGPCSEVVDAVRAARIDRYPDPDSSRLRHAIAASVDAAPDRVVVGNGAADLLWTLARVLVQPGEPVVIAEPTFAEFGAAARFAGARVLEVGAKVDADFAIDLDTIEQIASSEGARLVYLCSPGTPTGSHVAVARVAGLAQRRADLTIVLDQAFLSLSDHAAEETCAVPSNVVRVRSLTKDHAIAGIRLGYLVASGDLAPRIEAARPPWTTSSVAQAAGLAALGARDFVETSRRKILADRDQLALDLKRMSIRAVPSCAGFFVFPATDAGGLRARLLRRKILVRDCTSFGLPGFVRLAARPRADRERLLSALRQEIER